MFTRRVDRQPDGGNVPDLTHASSAWRKWRSERYHWRLIVISRLPFVFELELESSEDLEAVPFQTERRAFGRRPKR